MFAQTMLTGCLLRGPAYYRTRSGEPMAILTVGTEEMVPSDGHSTRKRFVHRVVILSEPLIEKVVRPMCKDGRVVQVSGSAQHDEYRAEGQIFREAKIVIRPYDGKIRIINVFTPEERAELAAAAGPPPGVEELDFDQGPDPAPEEGP